ERQKSVQPYLLPKRERPVQHFSWARRDPSSPPSARSFERWIASAAIVIARSAATKQSSRGSTAPGLLSLRLAMTARKFAPPRRRAFGPGRRSAGYSGCARAPLYRPRPWCLVRVCWAHGKHPRLLAGDRRIAERGYHARRGPGASDLPPTRRNPRRGQG